MRAGNASTLCADARLDRHHRQAALARPTHHLCQRLDIRKAFDIKTDRGHAIVFDQGFQHTRKIRLRLITQCDEIRDW